VSQKSVFLGTVVTTCSEGLFRMVEWPPNANGKVTSYSYDSAGNLARVSPPAPLGATTIAVDSLGRPVTVTDGKGQLTTYNVDDQVTQVLTGGATSCSYSAGTCVSSTYDADGNLATQTDQTGTTRYTYDNLDRQTNKQLSSGGGPKSPEDGRRRAL